jgi:hypothetical protein
MTAPIVRPMVLSLAATLFVSSNATWADSPKPQPIPTMSYDRAIPLEDEKGAIDLGTHVTVRCLDWNADGSLDLLLGGGDGRLWLCLSHPVADIASARVGNFRSPEPIRAGNKDRWGDSYTGVLLAPVVGNALPDLLVCHSGDKVTCHENIGGPGNPEFAEQGTTVEVQKSCQGRFDAADWDGDSLMDLVTGSFSGEVQWHRNEGTASSPKFGRGEAFFDIASAYNSHPRWVEFNQDNRLDLLLGVNWGTVSLYLNSGTIKQPLLNPRDSLQWSNGTNLSIRDLNGDDTTPELADLDGDGVLDLISGGKNGRIFFMRGVGFATRVQTLELLLAKHVTQLGEVLRDEEEVREQVFGALASLQADLSSGLLPSASREELFQQLARLTKKYPQLLQRARFDLAKGPHLPLLAGQVWVVLLESLPDIPSHRERVADAAGFTGGYRRLLLDLGVLLIDNDTASPEHLDAMHQLMMAMPRPVWDVETITVAGWLGPAIKTQKIRSRTGVNIFDLPLGRPENSFAEDSPRPGVTDVYLICLAHELAHNMLDTIGKKTRPELFERKFEGLAQAAGSAVIFRTPKSKGIDLDLTKKSFRALGFWDGNDATWRDAWMGYFKGKESFDRAYTRGNIQFFLDSPQEAFATLANQYFADSQLMLEFCKARWDAGHLSNINQFLLIADYLSEGTDRVQFYVLHPGGKLIVSPVELNRDSQGYITKIKSPTVEAKFHYQGNLVDSFELVTNGLQRSN